MELHQLRYVIAVAEAGSFSRAAERLFVAQSNVSAQVRKLEMELQVELFERRPHQVVLTDFGAAFLPGARQTLAATVAAREAVEALRGLAGGRMSLGLPSTVVAWLLPKVLTLFKAAYPNVELWITEEASTVLAGMVASRDLPQALVNLPSDRANVLDQHALFDEELVAVVPVDHRLCSSSAAPLAAFRDDEWLLPEAGSWLRELTIDACAAAGFTPVPRFEFESRPLAHKMAVAGLGVTLLPIMTALQDFPHGRQRIGKRSGPPSREVTAGAA